MLPYMLLCPRVIRAELTQSYTHSWVISGTPPPPPGASVCYIRPHCTCDNYPQNTCAHLAHPLNAFAHDNHPHNICTHQVHPKKYMYSRQSQAYYACLTVFTLRIYLHRVTFLSVPFLSESTLRITLLRATIFMYMY